MTFPIGLHTADLFLCAKTREECLEQAMLSQVVNPSDGQERSPCHTRIMGGASPSRQHFARKILNFSLPIIGP